MVARSLDWYLDKCTEAGIQRIEPGECEFICLPGPKIALSDDAPVLKSRAKSADSRKFWDNA